MRLVIPDWHPARLNLLLKRGPFMHDGKWTSASKLKRADAKMLWAHTIGAAKAKGRRRLSVTLVYPPAGRRMDPDAWQKSLLDALVSVGLLIDDSPKWVEISPVKYERGGKATTIELEDL